jgi:hypothetical protein
MSQRLVATSFQLLYLLRETDMGPSSTMREMTASLVKDQAIALIQTLVENIMEPVLGEALL